jgi:hypothetical protein
MDRNREDQFEKRCFIVYRSTYSESLKRVEEIAMSGRLAGKSALNTHRPLLGCRYRLYESGIGLFR